MLGFVGEAEVDLDSVLGAELPGTLSLNFNGLDESEVEEAEEVELKFPPLQTLSFFLSLLDRRTAETKQ